MLLVLLAARRLLALLSQLPVVPVVAKGARILPARPEMRARVELEGATKLATAVGAAAVILREFRFGAVPAVPEEIPGVRKELPECLEARAQPTAAVAAVSAVARPVKTVLVRVPVS